MSFISNILSKLNFMQFPFENLAYNEFLNSYESDPNGVLVDVRMQNEFSGGHIKGAKHHDISQADFTNQINKLDKAPTYYVYCRSGMRSAKACSVMQQMGFENVVNLKGGIVSIPNNLANQWITH